MPGYGFARVGRKQMQGWTQLIRLYLKGRPSLRRALLLIDARHDIKDSDRETMTLLDEAAVSYQIVLTKADKLASDELEVRRSKVRDEAARHPAAHPDIVATSARTGLGVAELRAALAAVAALG
jgi:GTP-binding protein